MENISLLVSLEGTQHQVTTDWRSLAATLEKRGVDVLALNKLHTELRAGLIVTTRGLTLAMKSEKKLGGINYEALYASLSKEKKFENHPQ
ncbi:hypothetical protein L9G74_07445 [Shewanella sp. C32]|uniref:Uncharacterized protein n=1 Tax=Shewanella electrica TaxID=515560 RepID=A0ABT2FIV2_9GAMM|nr:hypothetical protein [Shewanella electrica]MCH1924364.1 hypothetical protein [Shewanella electrica]MCS4556265.1 hypothetical protein [Shewanella electrica]